MTTSYVNAPATRLVATHCACCAKALVDAVSVETGVGPDCRRKHGFGETQAEPNWELVTAALSRAAVSTVAGLVLGRDSAADIRTYANAITHLIAVNQTGADVRALVAVLGALGFRKMALRIAKRLGFIITIELSADGSSLLVTAPFSPRFNEAVRYVQGQRWLIAEKKRSVPLAQKRLLWVALKSAYAAGTIVTAPNGAFATL